MLYMLYEHTRTEHENGSLEIVMGGGSESWEGSVVYPILWNSHTVNIQHDWMSANDNVDNNK